MLRLRSAGRERFGSPLLPKAVLTNFNSTGESTISHYIEPTGYTLIPLAGGKTCTASYCASVLAPFGSRTYAANFFEAQAYCKRKGARLCTTAEMDLRCASCSSGCGGKPRMVWTATAPGCNIGEHIAELESGGGARRKCKGDHETVSAVRCCADAGNTTARSASEVVV